MLILAVSAVTLLIWWRINCWREDQRQKQYPRIRANTVLDWRYPRQNSDQGSMW